MISRITNQNIIIESDDVAKVIEHIGKIPWGGRYSDEAEFQDSFEKLCKRLSVPYLREVRLIHKTSVQPHQMQGLRGLVWAGSDVWEISVVDFVISKTACELKYSADWPDVEKYKNQLSAYLESK